MKFSFTKAISCTLLFASISTYADSYNFQPGLWEMTTITKEIKGIPAELKEAIEEMLKNQPPQSEQKCISSIDGLFEYNNECKYIKKHVNDNKFKMNISCTTSEGLIEGTGEIILKEKASSGWFEMISNESPYGPMTIKNAFNAKYIQPCKQ